MEIVRLLRGPQRVNASEVLLRRVLTRWTLAPTDGPSTSVSTDSALRTTWHSSAGFQASADVLPGAGTILPKAHRISPFDLAIAEWIGTREILLRAKEAIVKRWRLDGFTVGSNVGAAGGQEVVHAHLHLIPRFADEPFAGRGIRWAIKQRRTRRPHPSAPGGGSA